MRVVSGEAKGRKLFAPKDDKTTRPTSDRVREALFNILSTRVRGATVLDMFAGTGALGIEALSRGASSAVFIDSSHEAIGIVRKNLQLTGFSGRARAIFAKASPCAESLAREGALFDLIFMDPPYASDAMDKLLSSGLAEALLAPGGLIVAEHNRDKKLALPDSLIISDERAYGIAALSFIIRADGNG